MKKLFKNIITGSLFLIAVLALAQLLSYSTYNSTSIINNNGKAVYSHELTIILDDAHGFDVAGKSSPDGLHKEWIWSKFWINELGRHLTYIGFKVVYTSPEDNEPGLWTRVSRMNQISGPALVISLHNNAAGSGEWKNAHGFSIWTTKGLTRSDSCATILFNNLRLFIPDLAFRQDLTDGDPDYECNFIVLLSKHPSFLIEYMFQDNLFDIQLISNAQLSRTLLLIIDVSILQIEQYLIKQQKNHNMATKLLIIHSTRTAKNVDVTPNDIRKLHRSWGWNCAGYNAIIQPDGTVQKVDNSTIDPWNVTFKVIGSDHCARHIAYVGGLDKAKRTKDTRTSEQSLALHKYVYEFLKQNPDAKIAGINQFAEFQNPGFDVQTWLLSIGVNDSNIFIQ